MKINFDRVLLGFFENRDKSPQEKRDKGVKTNRLVFLSTKWYNCLGISETISLSGNFKSKERMLLCLKKSGALPVGCA